MKKIPRKPKRACRRHRYRDRQALHRELDKLTKGPLIGPRHAKIMIALALAGAGALFYQIPQKATDIERDLKQQAMAMLKQHQLHTIHIDMSGLTATLTGHTASDKLRQQAARLIAGIGGIRKVINEVRLDTAMDSTPPPSQARRSTTSTPQTTDTQDGGSVFPSSLAAHIRTQTARLTSTAAKASPAGSSMFEHPTPSLQAEKPHDAPPSSSREQNDKPEPSPQSGTQVQAPNPPVGLTDQQTVTQPDTASPKPPSAQPDPKQEEAALQASLKCEEQFSSLLKKKQILFQQNSAHILRESVPLLEKLFDVAAHQCPQAYLIIVGHTDNRGSARYNRQLSQRRAEAVRQWLIDKGIPGNRLQAIGRGEEAPIASNRTKAGRAKNRRIEIRVLMKLQ